VSRRDPQVERLLNLAAVFFAARRPTPFEEIAGRVAGYDDGASAETLEKRFKRDRAALAEAGLVVDYVGGENPGYRLRPDALLPSAALTDEEVGLLRLAVVAVDETLGEGPLAEAARSAFRKIAAATPAAGRAVKKAAALRTARAGKNEAEAAATMAAACADGRRVRFRYLGVRDRIAREREAIVYALGAPAGRWSMIGLDCERRAVRTFRLDRVVGAPRVVEGGSGASDAPPADFRWETFRPERPRAEVLTATLATAGGAAHAARIAGGEVRPAGDGSDRLVAEVEPGEAFYGRVLAAGGTAEVVGPPELRRTVAALARAAARRAGGGSAR
jgi:proteasome accessory factor B